MKQALAEDRNELFEDSRSAILDVVQEKGTVFERMKKMQSLAQIAETFGKRLHMRTQRKRPKP